jgi:hypothetical protein
MTIIYDAATKTARMNAVLAQIDAGSGAGVLQIGTASMATILAEITLNDPAGTVSGSVLTLSGFPKSDTSANNTGKALNARIRDSDTNDRITGLDVGLNSTVAPAWAGSTSYAVGVYRTNGVNIYKCMIAGTSAGSGGPTGTGTGIVDGSVTWDWYCKANADIQLDSLEVSSGQTVTINTAAFTHA